MNALNPLVEMFTTSFKVPNAEAQYSRNDIERGLIYKYASGTGKEYFIDVTNIQTDISVTYYVLVAGDKWFIN